MKSKNGYALLMTVVVVSLLLILASSVLALSMSAYKASKRVEAVSKIRLAGESGIEKGKLMLKNYILVNTRHTDITGLNSFDYLNFDPNAINTAFPSSDLKYKLGTIDVSIHFGTYGTNAGADTFFDVSTQRNIKDIKIDVTASEGNASKKYSVILDKNSLTNVYFDQIFNYAMTTADDISYIPGSPSSLQIASGTKMDIAGKLYFQGSNLDFFNNISPNIFINDGGSITANTNKLNTSINHITDDTGTISSDLFENATPTTMPSLHNGWSSTVSRYLKVLGIVYPSSGTITTVGPILDLSVTPDQAALDANIQFQSHVDPFDNTKVLPGNPTLITCKVNSKSSGLPIKFKTLISGTVTGKPFDSVDVYESIIDKLEKYPYNYTPEQATSNYKSIYKLILVDGDLVIDDDFQEHFINYLIYCTGNVTFSGEAHFYNSSIFAKSLNFQAIPGYGGVQFYGPGTPKGLQYTSSPTDPTSSTLSDFSPIDKMIINSYLIRNLDGYADNIEYKVVQWK